MDKSIVPVNQIAVRSSTFHEFANPNNAQVVELEDDSVDVVERKMEDLNINHQFNEKNVPKIFQTLINEQTCITSGVTIYFLDKYCSMSFEKYGVSIGGTEVRWEKVENGWRICYKNIEETIETDDPEKSIVDHLWFILKNRDIKLTSFEMHTSSEKEGALMDFEKTELLLKSMLGSIDHQIHISEFWISNFSEDLFLFMLKRLDPEALNVITLDFPWQNTANFGKMKEIVETEPWKKAKRISSLGGVPLKIEDLWHYEAFDLSLDNITPEDVLLVSEHYFNSTGNKNCLLWGNLNIDGIIEAFQNDGLQITKSKPTNHWDKFRYTIVKSDKSLLLSGDRDSIRIQSI